ncbi:MAG: hypothetical protein K2X95_09265 [Flavobacteriaceae bacterium]|nr:hypothetical protein [Flavobacteriaceae bacterium]
MLANSCDKPIPLSNFLQKLDNGINPETGEIWCDCRRVKGLFLFNNNSKQIIPLKCKSYKCESCGPNKVIKFRKALTEYLKTFDFIRMWTFTQHTPDELDPKNQHENISKVWHHFIKEVRRDKSLSKKQRDFQYVKITEFTERNYVHYHVVINVFIPVLKLRAHWNNALYKVFKFVGGRGGVNIKIISNAKNCAQYLSKYVSKMLEQDFGKLRRWSKSNKISIFEKYTPTDKWTFFYSDAYGVLNLKEKSTSVRTKAENINVLSASILKRDKLLNEIYQIFFFGAQNDHKSVIDSTTIATR